VLRHFVEELDEGDAPATENEVEREIAVAGKQSKRAEGEVLRGGAR
jgi:hypothetical protein